MWNPGQTELLLTTRLADIQTRLAEADAKALNAERAEEVRSAEHPDHAHHLRAALGQVERALAKVRDGTYGRCDDCGAPIAPDRLETAPESVRCGDCG